MGRLESKYAVITGGTTGLGFEMAKRYIEEGARVIITGRGQDNIDRALSLLGTHAKGVVADSSKVSDLEQLAGQVKGNFDHVDILIANAGSGIFAPLTDIDESTFDQQFNLNVKGVFFTVQKILPYMRKGGSIILTSSAANSLGFDAGSIYAATKAAVRSFARSMAVELGKQNIRVNSLSPGLIPTQFFYNSNLGASSYSQFESSLVDQCALPRAGTPLEVANAAVFLGSDESSYVTAEDLHVDGGLANI